MVTTIKTKTKIKTKTRKVTTRIDSRNPIAHNIARPR
jgi:hypothetical protein